MPNIDKPKRKLQGTAVQIEPRVRTRIRAMAKKQDRSFASIVRQALRDFLARQSGEAA